MELRDLAITAASVPMKAALRHLDELLVSGDPGGASATVDADIVPRLIHERSVLQALRVELGKIDDSDELFPQAQGAIQDVDERDAGLELVGAFAMLRLGRLELCGSHVLNYLDRTAYELSEQVAQVLIDTCLFLSWNQCPSARGVLLASAEYLDGAGTFRDRIETYRMLTSAREAFDQGQHRDAARRASLVAQRDNQPTWVRAFAFELMGDAWKRVGDHERELQVLESWAQLYSANQHGAAEEAARQQELQTASGRERADEILAKYSRLAYLLEQDPVYRPRAMNIYDDFVSCWYDDYVDPSMEHLGTIRDRMRRLAPTRHSDDSVESALEPQAVLVESLPKYHYGDNCSELLQRFYESPAEGPRAVIVDTEDVKEALYRFDPERGELQVQLLNSIRGVLASQAEPTSLECSLVRVTYQNDTEPWIWTWLKASDRSMRPIRLGVRLTKTKSTFQTEVFVLYQLPEWPVTRAQLEHLSTLLPKLDAKRLRIVINPFTRILRTAARSLGPQGGYRYE